LVRAYLAYTDKLRPTENDAEDDEGEEGPKPDEDDPLDTILVR